MTTIADCIEIERNDGIFVRLTNHDKNLSVNGQTYLTGATFNTSAIKSSADLSVDNLQMDIGIDADLIEKVDFDSDLYKRAKYTIIAVNWENLSDGVMVLAKGWVGDITLRNTSFATLQLRGLTQALQRNFLNYYSPTCRAVFGDSKCGVATTPFRLHEQSQTYKVGNWALVPTVSGSANATNHSFEADGAVANGTSGISSWTYGPGSFWQVADAFAAEAGTFYLQGGDDAGASPSGTTFSLYQDIAATTIGMSVGGIDAGQFIASISAYVASPDMTESDSARIVVSLLDAAGDTLKVFRSDYITPEFGVWEEIRVTNFILPLTRTIRVQLEGLKSTGSVDVAFDNVSLSFWDATTAAYNDAMYRVIRIPSYSATDRLRPTNYRFVDDGLVPNGTAGITGWTYGAGSYWQSVASLSGLGPQSGVYYLAGGDDGSGTPNTEYTLTSSSISVASLDAALLAAGSYIAELQFYSSNIADTASSYRVDVNFFDSLGALISTESSVYANNSAPNVWNLINLSTTIPDLTDSITITLYARSDAAGSAANVGFDEVSLFILNTTLANTNDSTTGTSAEVRPTFDNTIGEHTYDGDLIWEACPLVFDFDEVAASTDRRVFTATAMTGGENNFYGANIIWITGANAGQTSFIRTWTPATKEIRLYAPTPNAISPSDKFMFAQGCGKSITECTQRFKNAINFRGEPFLPGPQRVLEVFTPGAT